MKDFKSRSKSKFVAAAVVGVCAASTSIAHAGPQSALDPYAAISAPSYSGEYQEKKKKPGKFGLPMLGKKKEATPEPVKETVDASVNTTTYVTGPGAKGKSVKQSATAQAPSSTKVEKASAPQEKGGMLGGIKALSEKSSNTFKAAASGMLNGTKAGASVMLNGTKKVGSGIATGAKASGEVIAKGAGAMGEGIKTTGSKVKDGTQSTFGKIAGIGHKSDKSPMQQATAASKGAQSEDLIAKDKVKAPAVAAAPVKETPVVEEKKASKLNIAAKFPKIKMWKFGKDKGASEADNRQTANKAKEGQLPL